MKDDALEMLFRGQEAIREELAAMKDELIQIKVAMAFQEGKHKGTATVIGAIAGFITSLIVHVFGPAVLSLFHIKK